MQRTFRMGKALPPNSRLLRQASVFWPNGGSEATNHRRDWNYQGRVGIAESTAAAGDGRKKTPRQPPDGGEGAQAPWQHTPPPPRHQWPPRKPVHSWVGIGWIILVLLIIGLWAGKLA